MAKYIMKLPNTREGNNFFSEILFNFRHHVCHRNKNKRSLTKRFQIGGPTFDAFLLFQIIVVHVFRGHLHQVYFLNIIFPVVLHDSEKDNFSKGNHLAEDEPDVNHLDVRGGGQALHLADEDGRQDEHCGQVHTQCGFEEDRFEGGGGKCDCNEKERGEVGGQQLAHNLSLHCEFHSQTISRRFEV